MSVIITGGTGLIGRALAAELATAGSEVVILMDPGFTFRFLDATAALQDLFH